MNPAAFLERLVRTGAIQLPGPVSADDYLIEGNAPEYVGLEFPVTYPVRRPPGSCYTEPSPSSSVRLVTRYVRVPL